MDLMNTMMGLVLVIVLVIVGGIVGARAWGINEQDVNNISNASVKSAVTNSAINSFQALETSTELVPLVVLGLFGGMAIGALYMGIRGGGAGGGGSPF